MKPHILVSDVDNTSAHLITSILDKEGYRVSRVIDGAECLELARAEAPDLIILDLLIPKIHGLEVLEELKADPTTDDIGVIICSAKDYKTEMDQARELGIFDFLSKPIPTGELSAMVGRYFDNAGAQAERATNATAAVPVGAEIFQSEQRADHGCFRLWGTRGSIPVSGPQYARHGGNTSCMEIIRGADRIILDAGSGIRELGLAVTAEPPSKIHL